MCTSCFACWELWKYVSAPFTASFCLMKQPPAVRCIVVQDNATSTELIFIVAWTLSDAVTQCLQCLFTPTVTKASHQNILNQSDFDVTSEFYGPRTHWSPGRSTSVQLELSDGKASYRTMLSTSLSGVWKPSCFDWF